MRVDAMEKIFKRAAAMEMLSMFHHPRGNHGHSKVLLCYRRTADTQRVSMKHLYSQL